MLSITEREFNECGCPNCGCNSTEGGLSSGCGRTSGKCRCCGLYFEMRSDKITINNQDQFGSGQYGSKRKDENDKSIMEKAFILTSHPRIGIPAWLWEPEDTRPEIGEYWQSRGPGYPDVSGFVRTKSAGIRILNMVHNVLGSEKCKTFLDYRQGEPCWVQFKFHMDEFDIDMLDKLARENDNIITKEIIKECRL